LAWREQTVKVGVRGFLVAASGRVNLLGQSLFTILYTDHVCKLPDERFPEFVLYEEDTTLRFAEGLKSPDCFHEVPETTVIGQWPYDI